MSTSQLDQEATALESKKTFEVFNPATAQKIADVPMVDADEVKIAVARGREAFESWRDLPISKRAGYLKALRDVILDSKNEIIETIVSETGKAKLEALSNEILYVCTCIDYYVKNAESFLRDRYYSVGLVLLKTKRIHTSYIPRGVVGIIGPWNFPFTLTLGEAVPALMAGNAVVLKPSEFAPLSALLAVKLCERARFPKHLFQVVTGYGTTAEALIDYADQISFTGSVSTGKKVMARAARSLKPVTLELGGKDPMIVLQDANLERAANGAVWGALANSGQICMSIERVYVEEGVADVFIDRVVDKVKRLRQGIDQDYDVDVGSMTTPRQVEIVEDQIADAVAKGARILVGGKRNARLPGLFFEPTVMVNVDHSMKIMTEETFGPVIPIMRIKDEQEGVRLANDSRFGLVASVWTRDKRKGQALARRLESGSVCVNDCLVNFLTTEVPFGGVKESGWGARHGETGIQKYCFLQSVLEDRIGLRREINWFPYSKKFSSLLSRLLRILYHSRILQKLRP
ncbi:MAG: succinic semialdehyde dehydrogenase [Acidobacteriia bacterium]|nr:succinic semialdehyde dehydrogenase [Terriglobia bacterium]